MKKFRLPRKLKKQLKNKIFFQEDDKWYTVISPTDNQENYDSYKRGELIDFIESVKKRDKSIPIDENNHIKYDDNIYIISLKETKKDTIISYDGTLNKQVIIHGEVLFKFKNNSKYFNPEWWRENNTITDDDLNEIENILNDEFQSIPYITIDRENFHESYSSLYIEGINYILTWENNTINKKQA